MSLSCQACSQMQDQEFKDVCLRTCINLNPIKTQIVAMALDKDLTPSSYSSSLQSSSSSSSSNSPSSSRQPSCFQNNCVFDCLDNYKLNINEIHKCYMSCLKQEEKDQTK